MSTLRIFGSIAIMIACFAVIYPRFMHPFVLRAFGLNTQPSKGQEDIYPPGFKGVPPPASDKRDASREDLRRQMRHGPHPGMRAAAEMQRQQGQQGSGRGMMGVVLPMYAIGIVLYLVYTLFKVFNKSKNNSWSRPNAHDGKRYEDNRVEPKGVDRMGFPRDFDGSSDVSSFLQDRQKRKDLEDLLTRVDDKNVTVDEMRLLQARLEETEMQMSRILRAMQSVQTNVDHLASGVDLEELPTDSGLAQQAPDSSPDMDSYEVVSPDSRGKKVKTGSSAAAAKQTELSTNKEKKGREQKSKEVDLDGIDKEEDDDDEHSQVEGESEEDNEDIDSMEEDQEEETDKEDVAVRQRNISKAKPEP